MFTLLKEFVNSTSVRQCCDKGSCTLHVLSDCILVILPEDVYLWIFSKNQELN